MRGAKPGSRGTLFERFERKYIPEPNSGCWLWTAANSGEGPTDDRAYGSMNLKGGKKSAHRISYELHKGEIPDQMQVLHHCDMPCCVNPEHLFVGTQDDNMQDMTAKKRNVCARGMAHHKAKLNPEKAFEIRWLAASGRSWKQLASEYGVAKHLIGCIVHHKIWRMEAHD